MPYRLYWLSILLVLSSCRFTSETFQGFVDADPHFISVPVNGRLLSLSVEKGAKIKKGDVLFHLQDVSFDEQIAAQQSTVLQLQALLDDSKQGARETVLDGLQDGLRQAQASYTLAKKRFARSIQLKANGAIDLDSYDANEQDVVRTKAARDQAEANIADAKLGARSAQIMANSHALEVAQRNLASMQAKHEMMQAVSPQSGYVLDTYFASNEWVPGFRPILSIVDPTEYMVQFYLPAHYLSSIKLGDVLRVQVDGEQDTRAITVTNISQEAAYTPPMVYSDYNNTTFVYRIKAAFNDRNIEAIHLGQPVRVLWK